MKFHVGGLTIAPSIWQAVAIVGLLFVLVLVMAYMSRSFMSWSLSGAGIGLFLGFLLALVLEGFLLIGGKTVITGLLGWKNAPAPVASILESGHTRLLDALGVPKMCWPASK